MKKPSFDWKHWKRQMRHWADQNKHGNKWETERNKTREWLKMKIEVFGKFCSSMQYNTFSNFSQKVKKAWNKNHSKLTIIYDNLY